MFKKLISNLPFSPGLINQVSFYTKRVKSESAIRRIGLVFVVLTMFVQFFAVISPPQSTLAQAGNDISPGGFGSQAEGVSKCRSNQNNYGAVLAAFGVSCDDLARAGTRRIHYGEKGGQLYSIGYIPYQKPGEQRVDIPALGTAVFARPLTSWGSDCWDDGRDCMAIEGYTSSGKYFMVLFSCGNLVTVGVPYIPPPPPPPPPPTPVKTLLCSNLVMNIANGSHVNPGTSVSLRGQVAGANLPKDQLADLYYTFKTTATGVTPNTLFSRLAFNGKDGLTDPVSQIFKLTKPGRYTFTLTAKSDLGVAPGSATGNCVKDVYVDKEPCKNPNDAGSCVVQNKRASNTTQKINDANGTTAQAGDVIEYTLAATNTNQYTTVKGYVIKEQIGDILEYADIVNLNGGTKDSRNMVSWPAKDIKPNQSLKQTFTVKVKSPIPKTPSSASDPGSFDMVMSNTYGDTVKIHLTKDVVKIIEQTTTTTLPNTGPGASLAIGFGITVVIAYFFARTRLFATELTIVREEFASSGSV